MPLRLAQALAVLVAVTALPVTAAAQSHVDQAEERRLLNDLNRARMAAGLSTLRVDGRLGRLARFHSADMAFSSYLGTTSPTAGPLSRQASQAGVGDPALVTALVAADLRAAVRSRALLESSLYAVGVGVVADGDRRYVTVLALARAEAPGAPLACAPRRTAGSDGPVTTLLGLLQCMAPGLRGVHVIATQP